MHLKIVTRSNFDFTFMSRKEFGLVSIVYKWLATGDKEII